MISMSALTPAVLIIALLTFALAVAQLRKRLPRDDTSLPAEIDSLLPQTQCAQCGYPGCLPYAEAVARFQPYEGLQSEQPKMRQDVVRLARRAIERDSEAFILVNNRLEGNSPSSIAAIGRMIIGDSP